MPYTLAMGTLWFVLALVVGLLIGWLVRSIVATRQVQRARNQNVELVELERLRGRISNLEQVAAERDQLRADLEAARAAAPPTTDPEATSPVPPPVEPPPTESPSAPTNGVGSGAEPVTVPDRPELAEAAEVLGTEIELDDLKVVEGIGPMVESLCHGIGIRTWHDLSTTEVSLLKTMLDDAGPRFRTHDPSTWPEQAALLAACRWTDFRELTQRVGRS